jgi:hypothetical protein
VLCGKTTESNSAYVGEQLAKIGHNDAPSKISHRTQSCFFAFVANIFAL